MIQVVAGLLIIAAAADWGAAVILVRAAHHQPPIRFLTAVAIASVVGAFGATVLVPLCLDALSVIDVGSGLTFPLLAGGVLLFSIPGPAFLVAYWAGYFRDGDAA